MYRNYRFNDFTLAKYFDGILRLRLNNEHIDNIPEELNDLLIDTLFSVKPGSFEPSKHL
jgi:hypothetical protein